MANALLRRGAMLKRMLALSLLVGLSACKGSIAEESGEGGHGGGGGAGGSAEGGGGAGGSGICAPPDGPGVFELGTGEKCFSRLATNDEVPLMSGPQGGYHVWLAVGCQDCDSTVHLQYGAHDPATGATLEGTWDLEAMVPLAGVGWPQAAGLVVNMPGVSWDPEGSPPPPKGTHVVIWVRALDGGEIVHQAEVEVVIGDMLEWDPCEEDPENMVCQFG